MTLGFYSYKLKYNMSVHKLYGEVKTLWIHKNISRYRCFISWKK